MKKIIFSSAAALLTVIGLSAFKTGKTTLTSYYWFYVSSSDGEQSSFTRTAQLADILTGGGSEMFGTSSVLPCNALCPGVIRVFNCIVGFTAHQLTSGKKSILINGSNRSQTLQTVGCKRSTM